MSLNLVGSHQNSLDAKRRVALPKAFREQMAAAGYDIAEGMVICRQFGGDPCLALFPPGCFEEAVRRLETMRVHSKGVGDKRIRAYFRQLRMSAGRVLPDGQSRITLTEEQCRLAGIEKGVAFVGGGDHLELWAPSNLDQNSDLDFRDLANEIFG